MICLHVGDCSRSSQTFSLAERCGWLRLIHAAYTADTEEKGATVEGVVYTDQGVGEVITVWTRDPPQSKGESETIYRYIYVFMCVYSTEAVDFLRYSVLSKKTL